MLPHGIPQPVKGRDRFMGADDSYPAGLRNAPSQWSAVNPLTGCGRASPHQPLPGGRMRAVQHTTTTAAVPLPPPNPKPATGSALCWRSDAGIVGQCRRTFVLPTRTNQPTAQPLTRPREPGRWLPADTGCAGSRFPARARRRPRLNVIARGPENNAGPVEIRPAASPPRGQLPSPRPARRDPSPAAQRPGP